MRKFKLGQVVKVKSSYPHSRRGKVDTNGYRMGKVAYENNLFIEVDFGTFKESFYFDQVVTC